MTKIKPEYIFPLLLILLDVGAAIIYVVQISTHTLTWSVTSLNRNRIFRGGISTHTLTWSVTKKILSVVCIWQFQLTRSRGA